MFIFAILAACGSKQTEPEAPAVEAPAADAPGDEEAAAEALAADEAAAGTPGDEEAAAEALAADEAAAEALAADEAAAGAPGDEEAAAEAPAADEAAAGMTEEPGDCKPAAPIYTQINAPLQAIDNASMQWRLAVHDSGYWLNTSPNGEQTGCMAAEDLSTLTASLAAADISAPELAPGMARCMAMPMTQYTVTVADQSASWKGPCGMNNPSESLRTLMSLVESASYKKQ